MSEVWLDRMWFIVLVAPVKNLFTVGAFGRLAMAVWVVLHPGMDRELSWRLCWASVALALLC
jgi:hypothetical protein